MLLRLERVLTGARMSQFLTASAVLLCGVAGRAFWLQLEPASGLLRAFEWVVTTLLLSGLIGVHGQSIPLPSWICVVLAFWIGQLSTLLPVPRLGDSWQGFLISIVLINVTPVLFPAGIYSGRRLCEPDPWGSSHTPLFKSHLDRTKGALHAHRLPTQPNC